jgi:hypothetical protein
VRTVVDFHFGSDGDGPTAEQVDAVRDAGGLVTHNFHVPIVRAEIDLDAIPALVGWARPGKAYYAVTVPHPDDFRVELIVMLRRDLTDADIAAVEALGARVVWRYDALDGYTIEIDDAAVPQVRALPGVKDVSKNGLGCFI